MKRFIEEVSRAQACLHFRMPVAEDNSIRMLEDFVEQLDLVTQEFDRAVLP